MPKAVVELPLFKEAKNYVFRLLKIRFRSEKELHDKLQHRGFSQETITQTISYFKQLKLVDDHQFARKWIASRLLLPQPFGVHRIRFELKEKGIALGIINEAWAQATVDYSEGDVVGRLAQRQVVKCSSMSPIKRRQRVYGYLLRRGFNPQVILEIIRDL